MERFFDLVKQKSITGTAEETAAALFLEEILKENPYYRKNPQFLERIYIPEDSLERFSLGAVYRGKSEKTILLFGHYDVVDVEVYGEEKEIAFSPEELKHSFLKMEWLQGEARRDIESGNFVLGRGTADMKMGLMVMLKVLEKAIQEEYPYSILYLCVPDEETHSQGMRASLSWIDSWRKKGLLLKGALLSEPCLQEEEEFVPKIHIGSCGKCMPIIWAEGSPSHIFEPHKGHNANTMLSAVQWEIDESPFLLEEVKGQKTSLPVQLNWQQVQRGYSVTVPYRAYGTYNVVFLRRSFEEIQKGLFGKIEKASITYGEKKNCEAPKVYTFLQLEEELSPEKKKELQGEMKKREDNLKERAIWYLEEVISRSHKKRPFYVLGFLPPYYPSTYPKEEDVKKLNQGVERIKKKLGISLSVSHYFMGISDMSFLGAKEKEIIRFSKELIGSNLLYSLEGKLIESFQMPTCVVGVLGKDIHQKTERVEWEYNTKVLPDVYREMMDELLK